ncbi:MAG: hypothetical protein ACXQS1_02695, partial [Methermicoccaceae archaeon]
MKHTGYIALVAVVLLILAFSVPALADGAGGMGGKKPIDQKPMKPHKVDTKKLKGVPTADLTGKHAKPKVRVEDVGGNAYAYGKLINGKIGLEILVVGSHSGRWVAISRDWLVHELGTDLVNPLVDGAPTCHYSTPDDLFVWVDHFSTRDIEFDYGAGWIETYQLFNET